MASAVFQLGRFEALRQQLLVSIEQPERGAHSNEWFVAATRLKAELAALGGVSGPAEAERKEIESGRITLGGATIELNPDFVKSVLLVSKELGISERYAAFLVQEAALQSASWQGSAVEAACQLYHREQHQVLECLQTLFQGLDAFRKAVHPDADEAYKKTERIIQDVVEESASQGTALPKRIVQFIDNQQAIVDKTISTLRGGQLSYPETFYAQRVEWVQAHRTRAGTILYLLSASRMIAADGILEILRWLQKLPADSHDPLFVYVLTAALAALDTAGEASRLAPSSKHQITLAELFLDKSFVTTAHAEITQKPWKHADVKNVIRLAWAHVLAVALPRSTALKAELGAKHSDPIALAQTAITSADAVTGLGAFPFLQTHVLSFRHKVLDVFDGDYETAPDSDGFGGDIDRVEAAAGDGVDQDFHQEVLEQVKLFCISTVESFLPVLRTLQRAEEDAQYSTARVGQRAVSQAVDRRHDIYALFDLIATVCRHRPESGLRFCLTPGERTTRFLMWALDVRDEEHEIGLFNMLIAISTGTESAWIVHTNVLGAGGPTTEGRLTTWARLFDWIKHYNETLAGQAALSRSQHLFPASETHLLKTFVLLLKNVMTYSDAALAAIYESHEYQALPQLFVLAQHRIPLQLRAALFDALAAFARPSHPRTDAITADLWALLNSTNAVPALGSRIQISGHSTIIDDLAAAEAAEHTYPATTSFIRLLTALVHPPSANSPSVANPGNAVTRSRSLFDGAFKKTDVARSQDLAPYVDFVVSTVFLRHGDREFRLHTERWRLIATCLQFMYQCLRTYSLKDLFEVSDAGIEGAEDAQVLTRLIAHPGFDLMKRLLQDARLGKEILSILNPSPMLGYEAVDQHRAQTIFYANSVRASMRILIKLLSVQVEFLELLLPAVSKAQGLGQDILSRVGHVSSYGPFDLQLQRSHESVVQIALFLLCREQDIATLAAQLLQQIADTTFFSTVDSITLSASRRTANRLVGLLEVSEEAARVRRGAVDQIMLQPLPVEDDQDEVDDDGPLTTFVPERTLSSSERTKLAILNLIQSQLGAGRAYPHIGHLLLGFDCSSSNPEDAFVPSAQRDDAQYGVLHALVDSMNSASLSDDASVLSPLVMERALSIIVTLCRDAATSEATLRFLRKQGNFFATMLQANPLPIETGARRAIGELVWADGARLLTSSAAVLLWLQTKTHLQQGFALEVHSLIANNTPHLAADLVQTLLVKSGGDLASSTSGKTSLVALLDSLDFEWHDESRVEADSIPLLEEYAHLFDYDSHFESTLRTLLSIQQDLLKKGRFYDVKVRTQFEKEAALLLSASVNREAQTKIIEAKRECLMAWRTSLGVILDCSQVIIRADVRGIVAFDILAAVLARLTDDGADADDAEVYVTLCGATLELVNVVRQHCEESGSGAVTAGSLGGITSERLLTAFKNIIQGILQPSTTATGRSNLYSAAIQMLQLLRSAATLARDGDFDADDTTMRNENDSIASTAATLPQASTVVSSLRAALSTYAESLIPIVARDAVDEADPWKTLAFTFLNQICSTELAMGSSRHSPTLDILGRQGYLSNFVHNIRQRDAELQEALAPAPSSLPALFVYQALFALLTRLAYLRDGLVRLVDVRIIEVVSSLDVIDLRPSGDDMLDNDDDFLPATSERYHDIVLPALQLCSVLANRAARSYAGSAAGSDGSGQVISVLKSVHSLLEAHQDTFTHALRVVTQEPVSLAQVQMATLLVKLLTSVLPITGRDLHSKAYLPYHAALNALMTIYLRSSAWNGKIVPTTAAEKQAYEEAAPSSTTYSRFDADVDLAVGRLSAALLAYATSATMSDSGRLQPLFSASLARPDLLNGAPYLPRATNASLACSMTMRQSSMASLGTLIDALDEHAVTLEECTSESEKIVSLMETQQDWVAETCAEIMGYPLQEAKSLGIAALRTRAFASLRKHQRFVRGLVMLKLDAVEMLLVLLLRHFSFYLDYLPDARENQVDKARTSTLSAGLDKVSIRTEGAAAVKETIERLSALTLPGSMMPGKDSRHALVQMAARRLQAITIEPEHAS